MFLSGVTHILEKYKENILGSFGFLNMLVSNVAFFQTLALHLTTGFLSFLVSYIARGRLGAMAMDCGLMV